MPVDWDINTPLSYPTQPHKRNRRDMKGSEGILA